MSSKDQILENDLARRVQHVRLARQEQLSVRNIECTGTIDRPASFYKHSDALSRRQIDILDLDATGLAANIRERHYSAEEVIEAYITSACLAQAGTNCLTWLFAAEAVQRARELDDVLAKTGEVVGPLHGVPISAKGESPIAVLLTTCPTCDWKSVLMCRLHLDRRNPSKCRSYLWGRLRSPGGCSDDLHPSSGRRSFLRQDDATAKHHASGNLFTSVRSHVLITQHSPDLRRVIRRRRSTCGLSRFSVRDHHRCGRKHQKSGREVSSV